MRLIRKMLLATDFSKDAQGAERRAVMLCAALDCETLEIMTVKSPPASALPANGACYLSGAQGGLARLAMRELEAVSARLQQWELPHCVHTVRFGRPAAEILARARESAADLTVVAAGGDFFTDAACGDNLGKLAGDAPRPLLVVKGRPRGDYRRVLVAIDFSEESLQAARLASVLAQAAEFVFLHALHLPQEASLREAGATGDFLHRYRAAAAGKAAQQLDDWIAGLEAGAQKRSALVQHGFAAQVLCEQAMRLRPDLVAVGRRPGTALGGTPQRALELAAVDVLIAPRAEHREEDFEPLAA